MRLPTHQQVQDEIAERGGATLLYVLAFTIFGIGLVNGALQISQLGRILPGNVATITLATLIFWLLKLKRPKLAAVLFVMGLLAVLVTNSVLHSTGVYAVAWVGLPIASMTAGWLLGRRAVVITAAAGIASVWAIYLMGQSGYYVVKLQPAVQVGITLSLATIMGALIGITTSRSFSQQLASVVALSDELRISNADLEARVQARTLELTETLQQLKSTQNTLIESERLASLGAMVAGISHELNTPLGNILMANSTSQAEAAGLAKAIAAGDLRRSALNSHLQAASEASALIDSSARKAIALISNFKRVAVDQSSELRRQFDLAEVVQANLTALGPLLRQYKLNTEVDIPVGFLCDSYPGPLGQIISNVVINAGIHGYNADQGGVVHVRATSENARIRLSMTDYGKGMEASVLARVFDPFFTTRLGKGGSGIGLAISKRIATNVLGGDLFVSSIANQGTTFTLDFPQNAPGGNLSDVGDVFNTGHD